MNWYISQKFASARDDKEGQLQYLEEKIIEAIDQAMIGGDETINLLNKLIERLNGSSGFRNLIPNSVKNNVLALLQKAVSVKKDSPHKCCEYLEEALSYVYK